jgi:alpha-glucosidase (family GH31 glycosyl hydrolase)
VFLSWRLCLVIMEAVFFGNQEAIRPGKRPFVISRSTFMGAGVWGGHWLGDNAAHWSDLKASIAGILTMVSLVCV